MTKSTATLFSYFCYKVPQKERVKNGVTSVLKHNFKEKARLAPDKKKRKEKHNINIFSRTCLGMWGCG